jgi:hypothetical protein
VMSSYLCLALIFTPAAPLPDKCTHVTLHRRDIMLVLVDCQWPHHARVVDQQGTWFWVRGDGRLLWARFDRAQRTGEDVEFTLELER